MAQDPGRVFPGKRMAGQLGKRQEHRAKPGSRPIDVERQLLLVKGAVPGPRAVMWSFVRQ